MSTTERHVRLFRNGRNQALQIPRELEGGVLQLQIGHFKRLTRPVPL